MWRFRGVPSFPRSVNSGAANDATDFGSIIHLANCILRISADYSSERDCEIGSLVGGVLKGQRGIPVTTELRDPLRHERNNAHVKGNSTETI